MVSDARPSVPGAIAHPHFMYMTQRCAAAPADVALMLKAVQACIDERGLTPAQIAIMRERDIERFVGEEGLRAYRRLLEALGHDSSKDSGAAVLFCEWARPHVDADYWGT